MLSDALRRAAVPAGRTVVMAARLSPAVGIGTRDLRPLDDGARVGGGRILPISITQPNALQVVAWNTGEASDLRKVGNRSHAEAQFFEFIRDRTFDSIEIEISHSPCTACIDMLAGWLRKRMESGTNLLETDNQKSRESDLRGIAWKEPSKCPGGNSMGSAV
jgi:hypothetical protein